MALTLVKDRPLIWRNLYMLNWLAQLFKRSAKILTVIGAGGIAEKTMYKIFDFLEIDFYFIAHFLERGGGLEKCNLLNPQNLFLNVASISLGHVYVNFLIAPFLPKRNVYFGRYQGSKVLLIGWSRKSLITNGIL